MSQANINDWLLMGSIISPIIVLIVSSAILIVCIQIGRKEWRGGRIKQVLKWYNLVGAVTNWYILINSIQLQIRLNYSLLCEAPSKSAAEEAVLNESSYFSSGRLFGGLSSWMSSFGEESAKVARLEANVAVTLWVYFISKIYEFLDPMLFGLQKYETDFGHIVHHCIMLVLAWYGTKYYPGGSTLIWTTISCVFLVVAYTYQSLRRFFDEDYWIRFRPAVMFTKHFHFFLTGVHCVTILCAGSSCGYPKPVAVSVLVLLFCFVTFLWYEGNGK